MELNQAQETVAGFFSIILLLHLSIVAVGRHRSLSTGPWYRCQPTFFKRILLCTLQSKAQTELTIRETNTFRSTLQSFCLQLAPCP